MHARSQEKQSDYHFPPFNPYRAGRDVGFTVKNAGSLKFNTIDVDRKISRNVEILYGEPLTEESKALLLLDDKIGEYALGYFANNFLLEGLRAFLNLRRGQHERDRDEFVRTHPNDRAFAYAKKSQRIMDGAKRVYNLANATSLFRHVPQGAMQMDRLVDAQLPLTATATRQIDILFENAIDVDDMQEAILFSTLYRMQEADIDQFVQTHLSRNQEAIYGDSIRNSLKQIRLRATQYLDQYHQQLEQGTFDALQYGKSILPALVATTYALRSKFFPLVTEALLQQAVGIEMAEVLSIYYEDRYVRSIPNHTRWEKTLPDSEVKPYSQYWQVFQADNVERVILDIAESVNVATQPKDANTILDERTIKELVRFVRRGVYEIGTIGTVTIAIASSIENTIDIFLTLPNQETVCLQIVNGYPLGIPQNSRQLEDLLSLVLVKVNDFAQQNIPSLRQAAEDSLKTTDAPETTSDNGQTKRRVGREASSPAPLPRKRKAQRVAAGKSLGIHADEAKTEDKVITPEKYDVTIVSRYSDALNTLPPPNKKAAQEAVSEWRKGQENRRAKWLNMSSKSSDVTIYSLRPDDLNRIILVHLVEDAPEVFYIFDIGPRKDDQIYEKTERLVKSGAIRRIIEAEKQKRQKAADQE